VSVTAKHESDAVRRHTSPDLFKLSVGVDSKW
jgi:hypothetical protein